MNKEGKNFKIWAARFALAGDIVMSLPILNYLELKNPNSYKHFVIAKKCAQFAPLFFNHPLIDCLRILENKESFGPKDIEIRDSCDLIINTAPDHPDGAPGTTEKSYWWNYYNIFEETFRMAGFDLEEYRAMPKELQYPVLNQWFDVERQEKTIAIWPFTSYGKDSKRAPSLEWWNKLAWLILENTDYYICQFGGLSDPAIAVDKYQSNARIKRFNELSILDQYKLALGCNLNINTNSGSGIILGAYGTKQISLLTNDAPNHFQNPLAFAPLNYKNNNVNIFVPGGFDNLNQDFVIERIKTLC